MIKKKKKGKTFTTVNGKYYWWKRANLCSPHVNIHPRRKLADSSPLGNPVLFEILVTQSNIYLNYNATWIWSAAVCGV